MGTSLKCVALTYDEAMSICRRVLETDAVGIEFDCGRVWAKNLDYDREYEMPEIIAQAGLGFTDRCDVICATGYQYFIWDIVVMEDVGWQDYNRD